MQNQRKTSIVGSVTAKHRLLVRALVVATVALAGCRASWTPVVVAPPSSLQWPFAPASARVTYSHALTGLSRDTSAASVLQSVVFGGAGDDRFALPVAVATASSGRIAVADTGCACVHYFLPDTGRYQRILGSTHDAGTDAVRMVSPVGVAFAGDGRLWVSDSSGALFAFDADGTSRFVLRSAGIEVLRRPTGIAWSESRKRLYVVDTLAHAVRILDAEGRLEASFGGRGAGAGQLNFPTHVAVAPDGDVYVSDALNFRIAIFDGSGVPAGSFGHHGDGSGDIAMPKGLAVDATGVVYVVDAVFDTVQLFNRRGDFLMTLGQRGTGFGEFWLPSGAFLDARGNFHVCDTYNRRIQVFHVSHLESEQSHAGAAS